MVITRVVLLRNIYGHLVGRELCASGSGLAECYTAVCSLDFALSEECMCQPV